MGDSPFSRVDISFDATVWSPKLGSRLRGTISISSPDHLALLVHGTFNASIPRHHIPSEDWVFEYGPTENDPEFGPNAALAQEDDEQYQEHEDEHTGRWVDKVTGKALGGKRQNVKFTVIGYVCPANLSSCVLLTLRVGTHYHTGCYRFLDHCNQTHFHLFTNQSQHLQLCGAKDNLRVRWQKKKASRIS